DLTCVTRPSQPLSLTRPRGASATFSVSVFSPTPATYQWFRECRAIEGATNDTLTIGPLQPADAGTYYVLVMNDSSQTARSFDASLDIGPDPNAISEDKLEDLLAQSSVGGTALAGTLALPGTLAMSAFSTTTTTSGNFISVAAGSID